MQEINLAAFSDEITDSHYYKKLQRELRAKKIKHQNNTTKTQTDTPTTTHQETQKNTPSKQSLLDTKYFQDHVKLTNNELNNTLDDPIEKKHNMLHELTEKFKYNGHEIMKHLSHKINFAERKDEFIEMYKYNLQQSRSHNIFTSRFAKFKVGIVGQILTAIGIPIKTLKTLKQTSMKDLFDENYSNMKENIYHAELTEILHGQSKKNKKKVQLFTSLQNQLITQMNNIGRLGFWSKQKLYEEKIIQCDKIKEEFVTEKNHLEYMLHYLEQKDIS